MSERMKYMAEWMEELTVYQLQKNWKAEKEHHTNWCWITCAESH